MRALIESNRIARDTAAAAAPPPSIASSANQAAHTDEMAQQQLLQKQQEQQLLQHLGHHHFPAQFLPQQPLPPAESQQQLLANDAEVHKVIVPLKAKSPYTPEADRPPATQLPPNDVEGLFDDDAGLAVPANPQPSEASTVPPAPKPTADRAAEILAREIRAREVVATDPKTAAAVQPGEMAGLAV